VKPFEIDKRLVVEAWEKVRANKGAPGAGAVSIGLFEQQWRDNLYQLGNRMSSGSYFPGPARGVEIPKDHGEGVRLPGVPNTADRVAQTAAAMLLEGKSQLTSQRQPCGQATSRLESAERSKGQHAGLTPRNRPSPTKRAQFRLPVPSESRQPVCGSEYHTWPGPGIIRTRHGKLLIGDPPTPGRMRPYASDITRLLSARDWEGDAPASR
jgi:hypothetical protein